MSANRAAPDPARSAPVAAVAERMRAHRNRSARMSGHEAEARVDAATAAGHITPAMRDWGRSAASRPTVSTSSSHPRPRRSRSCPNRSTGRARAHPARRISTPAPPRPSRSCPSRSAGRARAPRMTAAAPDGSGARPAALAAVDDAAAAPARTRRGSGGCRHRRALPPARPSGRAPSADPSPAAGRGRHAAGSGSGFGFGRRAGRTERVHRSPRSARFGASRAALSADPRHVRTRRAAREGTRTCRFGIRGAGTGPASGGRRHDGRGTYRRGPEWRSMSCKGSRAVGRARAPRMTAAAPDGSGALPGAPTDPAHGLRPSRPWTTPPPRWQPSGPRPTPPVNGTFDAPETPRSPRPPHRPRSTGARTDPDGRAGST
ncbi:phage protease [Palleronia rufa]|uniref:phage protease n=1 Tax=Palleronia rufa TaxID=1530186 RepID=UPI001268C14A